MTIRLLIADDHGVLRAGLKALLQGNSDMEVVAEAASGEEALHVTERVRPDVVLLDISMQGIDGIEVTRRLKQTVPDVQVLLLTMHEDTGLLREGIRAGAAGYIVKRAAESDLITAIQAIQRGELYVHPALTRGLLQDLSPAAAKVRDTEGLTQRELDVLRLLAMGFTNRQIAETLTLSVRTVESHRASIMEKLGLHTRADLSRYAAERGLLRPPK